MLIEIRRHRRVLKRELTRSHLFCGKISLIAMQGMNWRWAKLESKVDSRNARGLKLFEKCCKPTAIERALLVKGFSADARNRD